MGPFAEPVTGFGVGQVTTVASIRGLGIAPFYTVVLRLFSQTLVPWGAMANGAMLGAELAGLSPRELGFRTACISWVALVAWLFALEDCKGVRGCWPLDPLHGGRPLHRFRAILAKVDCAFPKLEPP